MTKKLQKADKDTNALIDTMQAFLLEYFRKKGIRGLNITREFAWEVFHTAHKLPYVLLINRNPQITYQGVGQHISSKHGSQQLVIKDIGKFEIQGVSMKRDDSKHASIKFRPSKDIHRLLESVKVVEKDGI